MDWGWNRTALIFYKNCERKKEMKGTKKLKRILAVMTAMTAMFTMTAMCSTAAMAAGTDETGSGPKITDEAQNEADGNVPDGGYKSPEKLPDPLATSPATTAMSEYLETLPVGTHTDTLDYRYGSVGSTLNVAGNVSYAGNSSAASTGNRNAASTVNSVPQTGDHSAILLWSMVVLASGSICAVGIGRKKLISK